MKNNSGFSTLEILTAFAIISIVLVGVILADFNAQYWTITSKTSNTALYKAKIDLENARASAKENFLSVSSSPPTASADESCAAGGLCYFLEKIVSDLSTCAKYVQTKVNWQVSGYPTSTTSLYTYLTSPTEAVALGGDCQSTYPTADWKNPTEAYQAPISSASVSGLDVLGGNAYVTTDNPPYLQIVNSHGPVSYKNIFATSTPFNAIDVAHDEATGRTYAYLGASSTSSPFQVADLTDIDFTSNLGSPLIVAKNPLLSVTGTSTDTWGWRLAFYDRKVYFATKQLNSSYDREFHIFDVNTPDMPTEVGNGFKLNTSVYAMAVRDQISSSTLHRFVFLATTADHKEIQILDVTDPSHISIVQTIDLDPTNLCTGTLPDARALAISGSTLYVGEDYRTTPPCSNLEELYAFDISDPYAGTPLLNKAEIGANVFGLKVSGPYLFIAASHGSTQEIQIRNSNLADPFLIDTISVPGLHDSNNHHNPIDFDGENLYVVHSSNAEMQIFANP